MAPIKSEMTRISARIERGLLDSIDAIRGDVPREVWVRRALEERLARGQSPTFPSDIMRKRFDRWLTGSPDDDDE